jgi:hypothetical protein
MEPFRIIDANVNRLGEGLRVIEEALRFLFSDSELTAGLKQIRTAVNTAISSQDLYKKLLENRDSVSDPGASLEFDSANIARADTADVLRASFKRCEEAARVIEEYAKAVDIDASVFKNVRFNLYSIEKEVMLRYFKENIH